MEIQIESQVTQIERFNCGARRSVMLKAFKNFFVLERTSRMSGVDLSKNKLNLDQILDSKPFVILRSNV